MVFILTPDKEYRQLPCPGVVTIGRGEHNTIVVAEKSVSTNHCKLTIEALPPTSKVQIWIEDLNSKNGTYAGDNRFEIERVTGKRIIHVGDLIRVGYCNNHLQIVDELPKGYQDINLPEIQIVPKNGSPGTSSAIRTMAPTAVIPPITQPASGNLNGSKSQGNFITSPNVPPRPNGLPYQSQDGFPSGLTPMQSVDPFLPAEPIPSQEINILPSQDPSPQPQLPALQLSQSQQPVQPASQLQPALDEAKQPANPLLLAVKLPSFHPFDRSNKGSLVKYLDLLDQWRDLLVAARGAMTKDQVYQEHYVKEVAGQRTKPKHKNNRFQNRYLQLASPRKTAGEDNEGGDSRDLAKEALLAELVAETMVGSNETSFSFLESALLNLHDMLHHCLLGAQIGSSTGTSDSKEMDYLVQNELVSVLQSSYKNVVALQNSPLLGAMHQYNLHRDNKCDIIAMTQQCVSVLERVMSFITKHEEIISIKFPISQYYEVLLAALSYVVEDLYDCYTVLLTLAMEADQAVITHTHAHKGHQKQRYSADIDLLSSYNAEVDEMRQVRYDADLLSLLERVREQESAVLSEKFKRIVRVVDIFTKWRLKVALYDWKFRTKDVKRQAIKQFDFSEKIKNKSRRRCWQMWREVFVRRRHLAKCLFRLVMVPSLSSIDSYTLWFMLTIGCHVRCLITWRKCVDAIGKYGSATLTCLRAGRAHPTAWHN